MQTTAILSCVPVSAMKETLFVKHIILLSVSHACYHTLWLLSRRLLTICCVLC
jgi:hypothetical protein